MRSLQRQSAIPVAWQFLGASAPLPNSQLANATPWAACIWRCSAYVGMYVITSPHAATREWLAIGLACFSISLQAHLLRDSQRSPGQQGHWWRAPTWRVLTCPSFWTVGAGGDGGGEGGDGSAQRRLGLDISRRILPGYIRSRRPSLLLPQRRDHPARTPQDREMPNWAGTACSLRHGRTITPAAAMPRRRITKLPGAEEGAKRRISRCFLAKKGHFGERCEARQWHHPSRLGLSSYM